MSSPSFHHQDVHSVILEDTPTAPPKPKRGIPRVVAPMKPQRSALKIEPLHNDNKENASQASDTKFKATDANDKMLSYFKRSIAVLRSSSEFTGAEATDILEAFITSHKDLFKKEDLGRKNAVMVLEWWRKENVLKNVAVSDKKFEDSDRAYYILCGAEKDTTLFYANSPITSKQLDDSSSLNRSSRRNNSFKRFFSPLVRRNRSNSRGRNDKDNSSTILKSTWSLFSGSDRNEKKAKQAAEQMIKEEECEIYELALFHLLSIIEVEFLEDVAIPLNDSKKHLSFLSSIMEKMGIGINEERLDSRKEDEMDLLIETHPLIRQASAWFQMARVCAPLLYLEPTEGKSRVMQLYLWCKAALSAVTQRLEKMTVNGSSPLFPNEFSPLLSKIAEQLINDMNSGEKLKLAILYLFLMVPTPLRVMIDQIIQWLQLTLRTDAVEDLRSPYYLGRKESRHKENCTVIIDELRTFLFPKGCMTQAQQNIFIETMIELRNEKQLGKMPTKLAEAYKFKKEENDLTPVRYTVRNEGLRPKELDKKLEGLSETEIALVQMIESILDNKKMSLTEKKKHLVDFSKHYPSLYEKYFKGML